MSTTNKRPIPGSAATLARFSSRRATSSAPHLITRSAIRSTTRTRTRTRTATARQEDAFVIAVIDNSQRDVGLCAYNLRGFQVQLRQFADSNVFSKLITALCVFSPVEIILSLSSAQTLIDHAIQACPHLQNIKRTYIGRTYFNETYGALVVEKFSTQPCPHLARLGESSCYLALASCGALIRYVEHIQDLSFTPLSLSIAFHPSDTAVFLDMAALEGLEVVANVCGSHDLQGQNSKVCLLTVMDKTKTRAGKRFLRRALLEPCAHLHTIQMRQQAVDELSEAEEMYFALCHALACFPDLERALAALMARENARLRSVAPARTNPHDLNESQHMEESESEEEEEDQRAVQAMLGRNANRVSPPSPALIHNVLIVKAALDAIPTILEAIQDSEAPLLVAFVDSLRNPAAAELRKQIVEVIDEQALPSRDAEKMRMQGAYAIRPGRDGRLDMARKILSENIEDMHALTDEMRRKYGLHKLELSLQMKRGYHYSINKKFLHMKDFPDEFIQIDQGKKVHRFSCEQLVQLNLRYQDSLQQIWRWTEVELGDLLNKIFATDALIALHQLCDGIAVLDCLASFVTYSAMCETETKMPKLTECGPIVLHQVYNPILFQINAQTTVPNDIFLDETSALHIISGGNGAGKSTFIRTIGLAALMAHTGCAVPAKLATVRVLKRIATRFNTVDDISQSESHFSKEMRDIASILDSIEQDQRDISSGRLQTASEERNEYPNMLVLIDELGRATSTRDGFAIAYAVAEELAASPYVLTLFTTHFLALGAMAKVNPIVKNFHLGTLPIAEQDTMNNENGVENTESEGRIAKFNYKVVSGVLEDCNYGLETARLAGFPLEIIQEARRMRKYIPTRLVGSPTQFAEAHLQLTDQEQSQLRKMIYMVSVVKKLNLIEVSDADMTKKRELRDKLREKVRRNISSASASRRGARDVGGDSGK